MVEVVLCHLEEVVLVQVKCRSVHPQILII